MHLNHTVRAHRPPLLLLHGYPFTAIVVVLPSTDIHTSHQVHYAVLIYLCLSTSASIIIYVHTWPQPNQRTTPPAAFSAYSTTGASTTTWHSPQKEPSQKMRLGNNNKNISILMDILWAPEPGGCMQLWCTALRYIERRKRTHIDAGGGGGVGIRWD